MALSIDGVVAGTARSYRDGSVNRVYVIGDPQFWRAGQAVAELHEIVGRSTRSHLALLSTRPPLAQRAVRARPGVPSLGVRPGRVVL